MRAKKKGIAKGIQSVQVEVAEMTRSFFTAPSPMKTLVPMLVISYLAGFILSGFTDVLEGLYLGTLLFFVPTLVIALISKPIAESLGGRFNIRRSFLMSTIDLIIVFIFVLFFALLGNNIEKTSYFIFAFSSTAWLRHVVFVSTSNSSHLRSLATSLAYPILGILLSMYIFPPIALKHLVLSAVIIAIFVISAILFLNNANRPLKKAFGIDGMKMLSYFLDHAQDKKETLKVEKLFESFASPVSAHVGVLSFKSGNEIKALMVVPSVHPGPFGLVGGSNLPFKLRSDLGSQARCVLVPHGPCTHDFNPPTSTECRKISLKVNELLEDIKYVDKVGRFTRTWNHANVSIQNFGGSGLALVSLAPNPTDDLDFSTGYAIREKIKDEGYDDSIVIDAHNCLSPGSGMVHFGSKISMEIIETAGTSGKRALADTGRGLKVGVAEKGDLDIGLLGPMGIQVLVVEVMGQKTAYILLDGNNMVPKFREEILGGLSTYHRQPHCERHLREFQSSRIAGSQGDFQIDEGTCLQGRE
jgi:putative membrane protein